MFQNRLEAGVLLADKIAALNISNPIVVSIPRGGTEVASPVARKLLAPLYVILPRKIGAPFNREIAVGALAPDGSTYFDESILAHFRLEKKDLEPAIAREKGEIERRTALYGSWGALPELTGHSVILIDDGIATGQTVKAALASLKKHSPRSLILGVPVLPAESAEEFTRLVDILIYLEAPVNFRAVGQFYTNFTDQSPEAIVEILEKTKENLACAKPFRRRRKP